MAGEPEQDAVQEKEAEVKAESHWPQDLHSPQQRLKQLLLRVAVTLVDVVRRAAAEKQRQFAVLAHAALGVMKLLLVHGEQCCW